MGWQSVFKRNVRNLNRTRLQRLSSPLSLADFRSTLLPFARALRLLDKFKQELLSNLYHLTELVCVGGRFLLLSSQFQHFLLEELPKKFKHTLWLVKVTNKFTKWSGKSISGIILPPQFVFASREEQPASRSKSQPVKNSAWWWTIIESDNQNKFSVKSESCVHCNFSLKGLFHWLLEVMMCDIL